ncbi:zinc finger domain-containing protein [Streptomyces sp. NPDC001935]
MLKFARDLEGLRFDLDQASNEYLPIEHRNPAALGLLIVINELTAGTEATAAVARAMTAYNRVRGEQKQHEKSVDEQKARQEAELAADEEITRKVACPTCGAEAGLGCVGTGRSGGYRKKSHADRFRLARSLNDGSAPADSETSAVS